MVLQLATRTDIQYIQSAAPEIWYFVALYKADASSPGFLGAVSPQTFNAFVALPELSQHTSTQSSVRSECNYFNSSPSLSPSVSILQYFCGSGSRSAPPDGASSAWQGAM